MSVVTRILNGARAVVRSVADRLPEPMSVRLRPARYRYALADVPPPPPRLDAPTRVLIGATNYATQGYRLARALDRVEGVAAINVHQVPAGDTYHFPADIPVTGDIVRLSAHWRRRQFGAIAERYTHLIAESGRPLFGTLFDLDAGRELAALRERGVAIAHLAHGSDLRSPRLHRETDEWSPFLDEDWADVPALQDGADRFQALMDATGAPVLVTTPELLRDRPEAHWMPVIVDPEPWRTDTRPLERERPVVLHAPTNRRIKGTDLIEPTLQRMHEAGLIEYRPLQGVPAHEMPRHIGEADIVLDQFRLGIYSVASVEAMAAGRVVVAHLHDDVVAAVREATGAEPPIITATPASLEETLLGVLADCDAARAIAELGPAFAQQVHDGTMSAAIVARVFDLRTPLPRG